MLIYYLTAISIITFAVWGYDKRQAQTRQWRIPERWLFGLILAGGSPGALAGMVIFRHKTRKLSFWVTAVAGIIIPALVIIWAGI